MNPQTVGAVRCSGAFLGGSLGVLGAVWPRGLPNHPNFPRRGPLQRHGSGADDVADWPYTRLVGQAAKLANIYTPPPVLGTNLNSENY